MYRKINPLVTAIVVYYLALLFSQVNIGYADIIKKSLIIVSMWLALIYCIKAKILMLRLSLKSVFRFLIFGMTFLISLYTSDFYLLALLVFAFASKKADWGGEYFMMYMFCSESLQQ